MKAQQRHQPVGFGCGRILVSFENGADQCDVISGYFGEACAALETEPETAAMCLQRCKEPGGELIVRGERYCLVE